MLVQRTVLITLAFVFGFVLSAYLLVQSFWSHTTQKLSLSSEEKCSADAPTAVNPNKMLFISCGGFIE